MSYFKDNRISDFEINSLLVYLTVFVFFSYSPYYRLTWWVENITVWLLVFLVVTVRIRYHRFSNISIAIITAACVLHTVGGHYSFQHVPGGNLLFFWGPIGRNNFDRMGHFFCGLLGYPLLELVDTKKIFNNKVLMFLFCIMFMLGVAAFYELIEWLDVIVAEARTGEIYLGTQNDPWDSQADMLNCFLGALLSSFLYYFIKKKLHRQYKSAQS